jgi:hypothetical protein
VGLGFASSADRDGYVTGCLAITLASSLRRDIARWGSMHEDHSAETGDGLASTEAHSRGDRFAGFVGWNLLALDMLQCETGQGHCMMLSIPEAP